MEETKKKLLVTASTFPRWEGDTEPKFVLDLSKNMLDEYDVTVLVPAACGAKDVEMLEGVRVVRYHYFPIHKWETLCYPGAIVPRIKEKKIRVVLVPCLLLALYFKLKKMLPEYDVVHAHWLIPQGIVQSFLKKPYMVTGHGGDVTSLNKGVLGRLKIRALQRAKKVTVVSPFLKEQVSQLVPDCHPEIISMGVDTINFGKEHFRENYFGQGDQKVILFVGRLAEVKGVIYLIEAMKKVDAKLVVVGDGPLRDELEQQAGEQGDKIVFLGSKTHNELPPIYASADVFVAPSVTASDGGREGFGLVLLEAMASNLPIVASNSGGIPQVIRDGYNGLLCEERDVERLSELINKVLADDTLRSDLLQGGREFVAQYDYKNIADRYKAQLREILNGND